MKRRGDLERLAEIRSLRAERAGRAVGAQFAAIAEADARLAAATAAAVANADRREAREGALFERLSMRPLTVREIGRAQDTLANLEDLAGALDAAEQEAARAVGAERERLAELRAERLKLERARDKIEAVAASHAKTALRRAENVAELDVDEAKPGGGPKMFSSRATERP